MNVVRTSVMSCILYSSFSMAPRRDEAPMRNNCGVSQSLPNCSWTNTSQFKASWAVRRPPAAFRPTYIRKLKISSKAKSKVYLSQSTN